MTRRYRTPGLLVVAAAFVAGSLTFVGVAGASTHDAALTGSPVIKFVKVTPALVGGKGGTGAVSASLSKAATCQLKVISHPLFTVTLPKPQRCKTTFTGYVKLGPNPTDVTRAVALDLVASRGSYASKALLYLSVAPKVTPALVTTPTTAAPSTTAPSTTTTTAPPIFIGGGGPAPSPGTTTTTTTPPATATTTIPPVTTTTTAPVTTTTTAPPVTTTTSPSGTSPSGTSPSGTSPSGPVMVQVTSDNWSGYALDGGPFSAVSGTFTVPALETDETCNTAESQWVGIDGSTNNDLIQAGIAEDADADGFAPCNAPSNYYLYAWWETLPNPSQPDFDIPVSPGDTVNVAISQTPDGWQITLDDLTDPRVARFSSPR